MSLLLLFVRARAARWPGRHWNLPLLGNSSVPVAAAGSLGG